MDFLVKRGRGLDPAVLGWLMGTLGVGPGIGEVHFLVKADSAYYSWLRDDMRVNPSLIHYSLADGENALTASRNDCLLVYPGAYDEVTELDWDKAQTHLVGLGGRNQGGDWAEPNVVLYTDTTEVAQVLDISGANSQFHNINVQNYGAHASNVAAIKLNTYGCYFENCGIMGTMTTAQCGAIAAASLYILGAGMYPIFKNCQIGQSVWSKRTTANSEVIRFSGAGEPNGGDFINCRIVSIADDVECAMVAIPVNSYIGRDWRFDNCIFSHFDSDGAVSDLNQAFFTVTGTNKQSVQLHNCSAYGIDSWQDNNHEVVLTDSVAATATIGGIAVLATS